MLIKCPHCDIEITHGAKTCPNCLGSIKYEYMTGPSGGRVKSSNEKWLIALIAWMMSFGFFWWIGESLFGGANFNTCFWLGLFGAVYLLVVPLARKDI